MNKGFNTHTVRLDESEEEMARRSEKMTSEMKTFKNRMYFYFIFVNLFWIIVCSVAQIFGNKLKLKIFSEGFVSAKNEQLNTAADLLDASVKKISSIFSIFSRYFRV